MNDEIYWTNGFIYHFQDKSEDDLSISENSTLVELIFKEKLVIITKIDPNDSNLKTKEEKKIQVIDIKIRSTENPQYLFSKIHHAVKEFVSQV